MKPDYRWLSYLFLMVNILFSICLIGFIFLLLIAPIAIIEFLLHSALFLAPISLLLAIIELFRKKKEKLTKISFMLTAINLFVIGLLLLRGLLWAI